MGKPKEVEEEKKAMQIEEEKKEVAHHLPGALQQRSFADRVRQERNDQKNNVEFSFRDFRADDSREKDDHKQAASSHADGNDQR